VLACVRACVRMRACVYVCVRVCVYNVGVWMMWGGRRGDVRRDACGCGNAASRRP